MIITEHADKHILFRILKSLLSSGLEGNNHEMTLEENPV
jgi:hypothetical protein